ncbi:MAG: adenosine kinase [Porticoccaceae bacterium]|nr:MAG: adenosine kinase [Porticoccaceae bacterium]
MERRYDVAAVGAALVDTEIEVLDDELERLGLAKGHMTLVDEARHARLLAELSDHLVASKRASGGSAANTALAVAAFGGRVHFCGKVADDEDGRFYLDDLAAAKVAVARPATLSTGQTGRCLVLITPDAERTMATYLGISATLGPEDLDLQAVAAARYLYLEGYLVATPSGRAAAVAAARHARQTGTAVALSLSDPAIVEHCREGLAEVAEGGVDLLFCNRAEALLWTEQEELADAVEALADRVPRFAVTLGSEGALVHDGDELHRIPAEPITAVDTNGAGDMFAGAVLYAVTHGMDWQRAGRFGCLAAAAVVGQYGPRLPLEQYRGLLEAFSS